MEISSLTLFLAVLCILLAAMLLIEKRRVSSLGERVASLESEIASARVRYGKAWEKLAPFMECFPWDPCDFRFIGDPVDGVVFGGDEIVFVEIKTGSSRLSERQKRIRRLVEEKRVSWRVLREPRT